MPAIKLKKKTAEYLAEKEREKEKERDEKDVRETPKDEGPSTPVKKSPGSKKSEHGDGLMKGMDAEILVEKRKRFVPQSEQKLIDWMALNFEKDDEITYSLNKLYDIYCDICQEDYSAVVDSLIFKSLFFQKFGTTFRLKENSSLKEMIKPKKKMAPKKKTQGESLQKKMKDIIAEAIEASGNPYKGVQFRVLKLYVASKYPALRVDLRPKMLKSALERGLKYGQVELSKGIGLLGSYRLPGAIKPEPEKKEKKKKKEGETTEEDKDGAAEENGESKPQKRKRKKAETTAEGEELPPKKKIKKKKRKNAEDLYYERRSPHSDPQKMSDTFPLAITYMSEPKDASVTKIKKYLLRYYPRQTDEDSLRTALEKGVNNGCFQLVSGGRLMQGMVRLMIDEFNPKHNETYEDRICQAIVACHEPKSASASSIKSYIHEYHPKFEVERRAHILRSSLEKAQEKGVIRRLTGIGLSGTFTIASAFQPSPNILAGEDDVDDDLYDDFQTKHDAKSERMYEETYIVRKTKSGRTGKLPSQPPSATHRRPPLDRSKVKVKPAVKKEEPEDIKPIVTPGKNAPRKKSKAAGKKGTPQKTKRRRGR